MDIEKRIEIWNLFRQYYLPGGDARFIHQAGGGQTPRNYRLSYSAPNGSDAYLFLQHSLGGTPESMLNRTLIADHLHACGVRVPQVIPTCHGDTWIRRNGCWRMFEYIPGDYFSGTDDELTEAAVAVARMHIALRTFSMKEDIRQIDDVIGSLDAVYWDDVSLLHRDNEFELMLHRRKSMIQESVIRVADILAGIPQMETIIHGDMHPHNFLFPKEGTPAIIDFGVACRADQRYDIAMACHRLCRLCIEKSGQPWQEALDTYARLFLAAYATVVPLCDTCVRTIPVFAEALLLRKMAYNFHLYIEGKKTADACLAQFQRFFGFLDEVREIAKVMA